MKKILIISSEYTGHGHKSVHTALLQGFEKLYKDNLEMFKHVPNLAGISPWILFDFRSPYRFHPTNQEGWNRKGLVSDQGYRKKAWHIINAYYKSIK